MKNSILLCLLVLAFFSTSVSAQDPRPSETPRIVGEVTVTAKEANSDLVYKELKVSSLDRNSFDDCVQVSNLNMKKDRGIFVFKSGDICFRTPIRGRNTGAVFIGDGEFYLTPPNEIEKKSLSIFLKADEVKEQFGELVMIFTDKTEKEIKNSPNVKHTDASLAGAARDLFRDKEMLLKNHFRSNIASRILADLYTPERPGFFTAFIDGKAHGHLVYTIDPLGIAEVYPEQVELLSYSDTTGGIWTAFHLEDEYKKGTANSWTDRRLYDITKHEIETTVQGTRLIVKDVMTLKLRAPDIRFLPFDLFSAMRVRSVRGPDNSEWDYIQEKKDEDADFGVILPSVMEPGKPFQVTVEYDGLDALIESGAGNFLLQPEARGTWYPNNPNTAFGDRAKFDLTFHFPKGFTLIGIGNRVGAEQVEGDKKTSRWTSGDKELAVAAFNYGDFKLTEIQDANAGYNIEVYANKEIPAQLKLMQYRSNFSDFVLGGDGEHFAPERGIDSINTTSGSKMIMTEAQNAMRIYNNYFGRNGYDRLAIAQQPTFGSGQTPPTLIYLPYPVFMDITHRTTFMSRRISIQNFWHEITPREVARQWWGQLGWTSYHDRWMSEGFAQFATSLYLQIANKDISTFTEFWENQRKRIVEAGPLTKEKKPYTIGPVIQGYRLNSPKTGGAGYVAVYFKGAYILHMIRMMMFDHKGGTGDERFKVMMTDFIKSHYNQDISTEDLKKITEKYITPEMNVTRNGKMDWFFNQWVYGTEIPEFKLTYETAASGGKAIFNGQLTQSGVSEGFASVVPLYMDFGHGWKYVGRITIIGNNTMNLSNIKLPAAPRRISVDVYKDVLNTDIEVSEK
ncbi:MAG TPA: M1 family aminopeptidase [Pyrinomonadaceae bacterium]|jgi:hypothetical protein|nr:M1 family aminopeptidase [Pyrinomonadaceae bacterium]